MSDLVEENKRLKQEIEKLKKKLKKYTNPKRNKKYYRNNKQKCIDRSNKRLKNLPKEKLREYRRNAYLKRKKKKELETQEQQ